MYRQNSIRLIDDKCSQLFCDSEIIDRKSTSLDDFCESIGSECAYKIVEAIDNGLKLLQEDLRHRSPAAVNRNYKPNTLNSNIQGEIAKAFPLECKFISGNRFCLVINGVMCFFKKVNKHWQHSNITTKMSEMYKHQKTTNTKDVAPIIIIGYKIDEDYNCLEGVGAIYYNHYGEQEWICDIASLASEFVQTSSNDVSLVEVAPNHEVKVKVKPDIKKKINTAL